VTVCRERGERELHIVANLTQLYRLSTRAMPSLHGERACGRRPRSLQQWSSQDGQVPGGLGSLGASQAIKHPRVLIMWLYGLLFAAPCRVCDHGREMTAVRWRVEATAGD